MSLAEILAPVEFGSLDHSHSMPAAQKKRIVIDGRQRVRLALKVMIVAGCVARLLIDDDITGLPVLAAALLLQVLVLLSVLRGTSTGLLALLMLPALFGASPWNSPVRASLGGTDLPLYLFDLVILLAAGISLVRGIRQPHSESGRFVRRTWPLLMVVGVVILLKVAEAGATGDSLRNAALFYYFPAICLSIALVAKKLDIKTIVPWVYLRVLPLVALAPVVVLAGIALGAGELVLKPIHQGMVEPAGALAWLPPGSLVLLSFCAAAFLFDRTTALRWKLVIVVLLVFDFATYFNRAMWLGIMAGIGVHWVILRGWRRGVLPALFVVVATVMALNTLRDVVRESHHESSEWRLLAWGLTTANIIDKPLWGHAYGESLLAQVLALPDSVKAMGEAELMINPVARSPHNSYLSLLFFGGLLQGGAVILFVLMTLARLGRGIVRLRHRAAHAPVPEAVFRGAVAVVAYSGFNVILETPVEGITYWIVLFTAWVWAEELRAMCGDRR